MSAPLLFQQENEKFPTAAFSASQKCTPADAYRLLEQESIENVNRNPLHFNIRMQLRMRSLLFILQSQIKRHLYDKPGHQRPG
jgi:hypothetical protein